MRAIRLGLATLAAAVTVGGLAPAAEARCVTLPNGRTVCVVRYCEMYEDGSIRCYS